MNKISKYQAVIELKTFTVFLFLSIILSVKANDLTGIPDFAFPSTVEKDSYLKLKESLNRGDGINAMRALMNVTIARSLISNESIVQNIELTDSVRTILKAPFTGISDLWEASILAAYYNASGNRFEERTGSDEFAPDPAEWSETNFAKEILSLLQDGRQEIMSCHAIPLTELKELIDYPTSQYYLDLDITDFYTYKSIDLLSPFCNNSQSSLIPFYGYSSSDILYQCLQYRNNLIENLIEKQSDDKRYEALAFTYGIKSSFVDYSERFNFLEECYDLLRGNEASGRILILLFNNLPYLSTDLEIKLYNEGQEWLKRFNNSRYAKIIKNKLENLARKEMNIEIPSLSMPSEDIRAKVTLSNMNEGYVLIYKIGEESMSIYRNSVDYSKFPKGCSEVYSTKVKTAGSVPFRKDTTITLPSLPSGLYVALPSKTPHLAKDWKKTLEKWSASPFRITDMTMFYAGIASNLEDNGIYVVDAATQKPLPGVTVRCYETTKRNLLTKKGITDEDGFFRIPDRKSSYRIEAEKGDNFAMIYVGNYYSANTPIENNHSVIFTDLSIYHPGDTVKYACISYNERSFDYGLNKNSSVEIKLRDANGSIKAESVLTTDSYGRASGEFVLPKEGLAGEWSIEAFQKEETDYPIVKHNNGFIGVTFFKVNDYKTPTFIVTLEKPEKTNFSIGDSIKIKGSAATFTGLPLTDCKVVYNVTFRNSDRGFWNSSGGSFTSSLQTNGDGTFIFLLPTENLTNTPYTKGLFSISAEVFSEWGEMQKSNDITISIGTSTSIVPDIPQKICVESDSIIFPVKAFNMEGFPEIKDICFDIVNEDNNKSLLAGTFKSPILKVDAGEIPSGKYLLRFYSDNDTISSTTVIYRENDKTPPVKTPLWVPQSKIVISDGHFPKIIAGSSYEEGKILCIFTSGNKIISKRWLDVEGENIHIDIPSEAENECVYANLSGMHNFDRETAIIEILPEKLDRKLQIKRTSVREKSSSGMIEDWEFSFDISGISQSDLPVMAVMTDKAINSISPFSWVMPFLRRYPYNEFRFDGENNYMINVRGFYSPYLDNAYLKEYEPSWQTYGFPLAGRFLSNRYAYKMNDMVTASSRTAGAYDSAAMEEMVYADDSVNEEVHPENMEMSNASPENIPFHPAEMPVAFFMPMLKTDDSGLLRLKFRMPDFNTTWQCQIMAYNSEMLSAIDVFDVTVSKPVMIRANLPLYVRTGDNLTIPVAIFNSSDEPMNIDGKLVVENFVTGQLIDEITIPSTVILPSDNKTTEISFIVPDNVSMLRIKSFAMTEVFSDGEIGLVPVYPSTTPIIESETFYMGKGSGTATIKIPDYPDDSDIVFRYCSNPLGECLLALPSGVPVAGPDILAFTKRLSSFLLAEKIANSTIGSSLLSELLKDSLALKSNLSKEENLKLVGLNETPWVNDAANETFRMQQLFSLLDTCLGNKARLALQNILTERQSPEGGWGWCEGMNHSPYITSQILGRLALLKSQGLLSSELNSVIKKAISYCDSEFVKESEKYKEINVSGLLPYLISRLILNCQSPTAGMEKLIKEVKKKIVSDWKRYSIRDKALAALFFNYSGQEKELSLMMIKSIGEFAMKSESKGFWFDNESSGQYMTHRLTVTALALIATDRIDPGSELCEGYRQWLLLQKETEDWGRDSDVSFIVSAILNSLKNNGVYESSLPEITINGETVDFPNSLNNLGIFTINLPSKQLSGSILQVTKKDGMPSLGGVICQYINPISTVKPAKSDGLEIKKALYLVSDNGQIKKAPEILHKGDKIRVSLTINCGKDMEYVTLIDSRSSCMQPDEWISCTGKFDGLFGYRETGESETTFFIQFLPKGRHVITYDCHIDRPGEYAEGIASVQCLYSPTLSAHSGGNTIKVED